VIISSDNYYSEEKERMNEELENMGVDNELRMRARDSYEYQSKKANAEKILG